MIMAINLCKNVMIMLNNKQKKILLVLLERELWSKEELMEIAGRTYHRWWNMLRGLESLEKIKLVKIHRAEYNIMVAAMLTIQGREIAEELESEERRQKEKEQIPLQRCRQRIQVCYMKGCYHRHTCDAYALKEEECRLN